MNKNVFVLAAMALLFVRPAIAQTVQYPDANQTITQAGAAQDAPGAQSTGPFPSARNEDDDDQDSYDAAAEQMAQQAASGSIYNSCTPNPFALCSGPKPSKKHKFLRACWNAVCP